jgi:hypothetical protein
MDKIDILRPCLFVCVDSCVGQFGWENVNLLP